MQASPGALLYGTSWEDSMTCCQAWTVIYGSMSMVWNPLLSSRTFPFPDESLLVDFSSVMGHHPFTNVVDHDPDVFPGNPDIVRFHESQSWWSYYSWQSYYLYPLYAQLAWSRWSNEWYQLLVARNYKGIPINPLQLKEYFWTGIYLVSTVLHLSRWGLQEVLTSILVEFHLDSYCDTLLLSPLQSLANLCDLYLLQ